MGSDVLLLRVLFCLGLLTSACSSGKRTAMDQNLVAETPVETQVISVVQGRLSNWSYTDWDRRNRGEQLEVVWSTHNSPGLRNRASPTPPRLGTHACLWSSQR